MKDAKKIPVSLERWLKQTGHAGPYQRQLLSGGDINNTLLLTTETGQQFCIKQPPHAPPDFFACEAEGLAAIENTQTLRTPRVMAVEKHFIVLEYLPSGRRHKMYWQQLGEQLAAMHLSPCSRFGFHQDNYCGRLKQINHLAEDGHQFFREHRLHYQAGMALASGLLSQADVDAIAKLGERLPELIPKQKSALLHGDLWAGNIHGDGRGNPVVIDPAVYWGWPEADLAMTLLFGGFNEGFYQSYEAVRPLDSGWRERSEIYNIYHLLNHANHFGGGYARQAMAIVKRYCGN